MFKLFNQPIELWVSGELLAFGSIELSGQMRFIFSVWVAPQSQEQDFVQPYLTGRFLSNKLLVSINFKSRLRLWGAFYESPGSTRVTLQSHK